MQDILRFIFLPGIVILAVTWWVALRHSLRLLPPFLLVMVASAGLIRLAGFSPLVFFVSMGGYVIFATLASVAGVVLRDLSIRMNRLRP